MLSLLANLGGSAAAMFGKELFGQKYGDQLGSLLGSGLSGLGDAFGLMSGGSSAAQQPWNDLQRAQQMSSYTATGAEGAEANRVAAEAARRKIGQVDASTRLAAQQTSALGSQALGGVQLMNDLTRATTERSMGNQARNIMQQIGSAGGSAAAKVAGAGALGESQVQALGNLAQEGARLQQAAIGQAGDLFGRSEAITQAGRAQNLAEFQPYSLQKFGGTNLGQLGQYQQIAQGIQAAEDPAAIAKTQAGQSIAMAMNRPFTNETAMRAQLMSLLKDPEILKMIQEQYG